MTLLKSAYTLRGIFPLSLDLFQLDQSYDALSNIIPHGPHLAHGTPLWIG